MQNTLIFLFPELFTIFLVFFSKRFFELVQLFLERCQFEYVYFDQCKQKLVVLFCFSSTSTFTPWPVDDFFTWKKKQAPEGNDPNCSCITTHKVHESMLNTLSVVHTGDSTAHYSVLTWHDCTRLV